MIKIAFAGAQDVGKTTIAKELSSRFKTKNFITDYVEESARLYISRWGESVNNLSDQLFIIDKQIERESYVSPKCDLLFTDSPLFLALTYTILANKTFNNSQKNRDIYISIYEKILKYGFYDHIFFLTPFKIPEDDGIRSHELINLNSTIDKMIKSYLDLHLMKYTEVNHPTITERIEYIDKELSKVLKKF